MKKNIIDTSNMIREMYNLQDEIDDLQERLKADQEYVDELKEQISELLPSEKKEIEELESDLEAAEMSLKGSQEDVDEWHEYDNLKELKAVISDLKEYNSDVKHGVPIIRQCAIKNYIVNEISELYPGIDKMPHFIAIDWDQTVDNVLQDYYEFEYQNDTYYIRRD
jgi:cell division protein FtsL